jgi:hypothetical protein
MIATTIYNTYRFCNVTGRSSGMVPPILLLLSILHSIDSKKKIGQTLKSGYNQTKRA